MKTVERISIHLAASTANCVLNAWFGLLKFYTLSYCETFHVLFSLMTVLMHDVEYVMIITHPTHKDHNQLEYNVDCRQKIIVSCYINTTLFIYFHNIWNAANSNHTLRHDAMLAKYQKSHTLYLRARAVTLFKTSHMNVGWTAYGDHSGRVVLSFIHFREQQWSLSLMKLKWWLTPYDLTDTWLMYIP